MNDTDFIKVMKESGFTEKEVCQLIAISQRDTSALQSDVLYLSKIFYRIAAVFILILILTIIALFDIGLSEGKLFMLFIFMLVFSIFWHVAPVKLSYKSHRLYKKYMHLTGL
jgi:hypothetical protein